MAAEFIVLGHFRAVDRLCSALAEMKHRGHEHNLEIFSPFPVDSLQREFGRGRPFSPVRLFTLLGAVSGCLLAFLFTSWMSMDYPIQLGAKPIVSIPAFVVIAFECTVLFGALFCLISMLFWSRIPSFRYHPEYRAEFSGAVFGLAVRVGEESCGELKKQLEILGAEKVELQYVR